MNPDPPLCSSCGAALDASAPGGLCPRCLMAGALLPTDSPTGARLSAPPTVGQVAAAFPQLEVLALIGAGGMGAVFRARQPKLNRLVALKVLPASLAERDPAFAERFEREGQMLARLHHPNIVAVYDSGRAGDFFYLLMEHVDGVNLRQAMRASRFTPAQALGIVPRICDALQFAHDEGVLHRDIKPENILLDAKGRVKLADFGIGKIIGEASEPARSTAAPAPGLTQTGTALGTPQYMAPEQRDRPELVDHRADIYSLGVVFYELLTGELPVGQFAPPSEISASDPRVDAIVRQALEKERDRRQQSAGEVRTQVETVAQQPFPAAAPSPSTPVAPPRSSGKTHTQIVALLHIGLGMFTLLIPLVLLMALGIPAGITIFQGEFEAAGILGIIGVGIAGFIAILALPGIIGGYYLYRGRPWARVVVLILGVLHLWNIPFGTALGIYTLWALLNETPTEPATGVPVRSGASGNGLAIGCGVLFVLGAGVVLLGALGFVGLRFMNLNHARGRAQAAMAQDAQRVATGLRQVRFAFSHPDQSSGGHELTLRAKDGRGTRWHPNSGQPFSLKDGKNLTFRVRIDNSTPDSAVASVSTAVKGGDWETKQTNLGPGITSTSLDFTNGLHVAVRLLGEPPPAQTPTENPSADAAPGPADLEGAFKEYEQLLTALREATFDLELVGVSEVSAADQQERRARIKKQCDQLAEQTAALREKILALGKRAAADRDR